VIVHKAVWHEVTPDLPFPTIDSWPAIVDRDIRDADLLLNSGHFAFPGRFYLLPLDSQGCTSENQ
jgi:hypothetical protein